MNDIEPVDISIVSSEATFEFSDYILSSIGTAVSTRESWTRGDLSFANISNKYGYLNWFELCLNLESAGPGLPPKPIDEECGKAFRWISREVRKMSSPYNDLCVMATGAKLNHSTRMSVGSRTALLEDKLLLVGGASPRIKPVVIIGLCSQLDESQPKLN